MRKPGYRVGVLTFANHPAAFLRPGTRAAVDHARPPSASIFSRGPGFEECFLITFDEQRRDADAGSISRSA